MLSTAFPADHVLVARRNTTVRARVPAPAVVLGEAGQRIADSLNLVQDAVAVTRRLLHAGDSVYEAGERFASLHLINSGIFKIVNLSSDGRE